MKKLLPYITGLVLFFTAMVWWSKSLQNNDPDIISRTGIHWHPQIEIYVNDKKQEISPNIGISGGAMMPMHTHKPDGTVHIESVGVIRKDNITLGQFFQIWGKNINSFGTNLKMTVNGTENTEYENYVMGDKDKIELWFD